MNKEEFVKIKTERYQVQTTWFTGKDKIDVIHRFPLSYEECLLMLKSKVKPK